MPRIGYRLEGKFELDKKEAKRFFYDYYFAKLFGKSVPRKNVIRFSTLHESVKWHFRP
jgi:hypothetical protein